MTDRIADLFRSTQNAADDNVLETPEEDTVDEETLSSGDADQEADQEGDDLNDTLESLESLKVTLEHLQANGGASPAFNQLLNHQLETVAIKTGVTIRTVSLESIDGSHDYTASLEAVSGLLNRFLQAQIVHFKSLFDSFGGVILGRARKAAQYRNKIDGYRKEWAEKKPKTKMTEIVGSYAGKGSLIVKLPLLNQNLMAMAFMRNNKLDYDPLKATTEDLAISRQLMTEYPKKLSEYLGKVNSILGSAKLDSDESFHTSVVKKLAALPHPSTLIDAKLVNGGPTMLLNVGLTYKTGRQRPTAGQGPDFEKLALLSQKKTIVPKNFPGAHYMPAIMHDVTMNKNDLDKLLENADGYMELVANYMRNFDSYFKNFKALSKTMDKIGSGDNGLSSEGKTQLRQVGAFIDNLAAAAKSPIKREVNRAIQVGILVAYFGARMIYQAK